MLGDLCHDAEAGRYAPATADYALAVTGQDAAARPASRGGPPLAQQTVMLRHSHRFGGPIGELAAAVNRGDARSAPPCCGGTDSGALHWLQAPSPRPWCGWPWQAVPGPKAATRGYLQAMRAAARAGDATTAALRGLGAARARRLRPLPAAVRRARRRVGRVGPECGRRACAGRAPGCWCGAATGTTAGR